MEFREHRLENGLEIVAECNPRAYSLALGFFVKTGARDEWAEVSGVSHFLEHMCFKGTPRRSAADVNRELDEIGSHANALTGEERTVYHAALLPEFQARAVDLLSDILRPALREDDFNTEKEVIVEEIRMYDDQPPYGAYERCLEAFYGTHPLSHRILGTPASIAALTAEHMRAYFEQQYSPTNIVLAAAGKVDFAALVAQAELGCAHWSPCRVQRAKPPAAPRAVFELMLKENSSQEYALQMCAGPAAEDDDRFAARLLATVFGDDTGSRLYWEFIDSGQAEAAEMSVSEHEGAGAFMTYLVCAPDSTESNLARLAELQSELEAGGITAAELEQAKNKVCAHIVCQSERPMRRLFPVGQNWMQRRSYRTVRQIVDLYQSVSLDDVHRVLAKYPLTRHTTVCVGPLESLAGHSATA